MAPLAHPGPARTLRCPAAKCGLAASSFRGHRWDQNASGSIRVGVHSGGRGFCPVQALLQVGSRLQDNADYYRVLKTSDGKSLALSNYQGKKPVVLFFYPKAATPGCTKEACAFRDSYEVFKDAGAEVFGISTDTPEANAEFAKAQRLPFPLLTDQSGFLRKSFGIKGDLFGMLPGRQTYVIDKSGNVVLSFNDQLNAEKHVKEALQAIKSLT